jgi:aryl-alcohol dehydrogenase-like predicted oxidoreductase
METSTLGSNGPEISVVGFGAWEAGGDLWGPNESDDRVVAAIQAGMDAGMTWVDTAEVYGQGRSEELVARALEGRGDEVLIFTKVAPQPTGSGFRPEEVHKAIRGSLDRLRTEQVDLYQLHWPDESGVPLEDTWGAMAEVVQEGLARHVGVSNFNRAMVERCQDIHPVTSVQNELSLLHQEDRGDLLPSLQEMDVGYLAYSPLGLGLLTGAIGKDTKFHEKDWRSGSRGRLPEIFRPGSFEKNLAKVERLRPIAGRLGTTVSALSLRWVIEQKGVTAAIGGTRNPDHARGNATAGDLRLDAQTLEEIDRIFG